MDMRHPTRFLLTLLALVLFISACGSDDNGTAGTDGDPGSTTTTPGVDPLAAGNWMLTSATVADQPADLLDSHPVTLTIDGTTVGGTAACNGYSGALATGDTIFDGFAVTEMACEPPAAMDLETLYLDALITVSAATLEGDTLVLTGDGVELRFEAVPDTPDHELTGTNWLLESLVDGDAVSSPLDGGEIDLVLEEGGRLTGTDGCNAFNGEYTLEGGTLGVGPLAQTRKLCEPDVMTQADHITTVLGTDVTFSIDGDQLTLTGADALGLVYRAEMAAE